MSLRCVWKAAGILVLLSRAAAPASADVVDAAPGGFTVRAAFVVPKSAEVVYDSIVDVGSWWSPEHSWSGESANLSIEARAGGCFCEKLEQGSVQHMQVVYADRGKLFRMSGGLGPLQGMGLSGSMTFELSAEGDTTTTTMTYVVSGHRAGGLDPLAPVVNEVLTMQVGRLESFIRGGRAGLEKMSSTPVKNEK